MKIIYEYNDEAPGVNEEIERRLVREQEVMLARIERDRLEREGGKESVPTQGRWFGVTNA